MDKVRNNTLTISNSYGSPLHGLNSCVFLNQDNLKIAVRNSLFDNVTNFFMYALYYTVSFLVSAYISIKECTLYTKVQTPLTKKHTAIRSAHYAIGHKLSQRKLLEKRAHISPVQKSRKIQFHFEIELATGK